MHHRFKTAKWAQWRWEGNKICRKKAELSLVMMRKKNYDSCWLASCRGRRWWCGTMGQPSIIQKIILVLRLYNHNILPYLPILFLNHDFFSSLSSLFFLLPLKFSSVTQLHLLLLGTTKDCWGLTRKEEIQL